MRRKRIYKSPMFIDGFLTLWFILAFASCIFVLWDQLTNTPSPRVMTAAWVLMMLYTGPLGLFIYLLSCRQPLPGTHDAYIQSHWKQSVGSLIHCVSGDATAIICMAALLHYVAIPNGWELVLEYAAAYLFGLFIFQALFMKAMFRNYPTAVKKTTLAETVSMNYVMVGMFPVMILLRGFYPIGSNPEKPYFWAIMSLATIVGSITAYPINSWLVRRGIKHGMTTRMAPKKKPQSGHPMHHEGLSARSILYLVLISFAILIAALFITSRFAPIYF